MNIKENTGKTIKKLKTHDFSITKFTKDLSYGKKHEKLVMKSRMNYELKTDRLAHKTGNVFVEFESRGKASGIVKQVFGYLKLLVKGIDIYFLLKFLLQD